MYPTKQYAPTCVDGAVGDTFCQTDNAALTVWIGPSLPGPGVGRMNVTTALISQFEPTDLDVRFLSAPVYSGQSETDVIYEVGGVPSGFDGMTWCDDAVTATKCDQHYIGFRTNTPSVAIACHETGHAVGLTHGPQAAPRLPESDPRLGCMRNPAVGDSLGVNNVENINKTY
jgi:hypothetical protein